MTDDLESISEAKIRDVEGSLGALAARLRKLTASESAWEARVLGAIEALAGKDPERALALEHLASLLRDHAHMVRTEHSAILAELTKTPPAQERTPASPPPGVPEAEIPRSDSGAMIRDEEPGPATVTAPPSPIGYRFSFRQAMFAFWTRTVHGKLLALTCYALAPLWRRIRWPRRPAAGTTTVCHVTCSFDLGGTQRQIRNLCLGNGDARFAHITDEIFPEQNFIYRRGIRLESGDYVKGNFVFKALGRRTMDINFRSLQLVQVYKLWRDFQRLRPDVVVGWGHEIAMLTFVAAAFARVPKIVFCIRTWNPDLGWTSIPRLLRKSHKRMLPRLAGVVVNSTLLQDDYARWQGIPPDRISVCPNGIDLEPFADDKKRAARLMVRRALGIPEDALVIMNIGRFSREKGQMTMLRAFERVLGAEPGARLRSVFCGDGVLIEEAKAFAAGRGIRHCFFPGRVQDVQTWLCSADIYVMPSDFEGMPNAMMEAMACGLPCVSTKRSGALDIARDRQEALYVDVGADDQLAGRLLDLIRNPDERRRLGENAVRRLKEFSVDRMVERFNGILDRVANG
jgi:glycosyltransferase involved in cell wall biosynthesis